MAEAEPAGGKYRMTLAALEASSHIPLEQTQEEHPSADAPAASWADDEERRQARLAGGA